jgi:DNA polymerase elongation subunit (family B)
MKILYLDIETAPNKAFVWGMFDQNISAEQMIDSSYVLCWSAKWAGSKTMYHDSVQHNSAKKMLKPIYKLLDEADVVIHYNGLKFDIPVLNKEFVKNGYTAPPSPYKQLDMMQVCKRVFRFESNKLSYVLNALKLGSKIKTNFQLWVDCMDGDPKAWAKMLKYNHNDVRKLEHLHRRLRPWIANHPNMSAELGTLACPKCGGNHYHKYDKRILVSGLYQRYKCNSCGGTFRSNKRLNKPCEIGINIT